MLVLKLSEKKLSNMTDNIQEKIENKVIDCINNGVSGRLIIFKPEHKALADYLAVERRGKYSEGAIYFQVNGIVGPIKDDIFVKDFQEGDIIADKDFYLFFIYFDIVEQKINDYIWLVPALQFEDIAQTIKGPDGKKILRFEAPLDIKNKNKYSKFLVKTQDLGKTILAALEKGGKFDFKDVDFLDKRVINLGSLKEFLCEARKNTYASDGNPVDNPRLLSSSQLEFQRGDYFYRDIYFSGDKNFIGQEIIYQDAKPIWGMNYIGDAIERREVEFLKESLFKLAEKCRLGGSCEHKRREFKYQDSGQGDLREFSGREIIFSAGKKIYKLDYQGGMIVK